MAAEQDIAVLVSSCDRFQDMWKPFFALFFHYWPDCPFPLYLMSNRLSYPDSRVTTLAVGDRGAWATECREALGQIRSRYVLFIMEDCLLDRAVATERVASLVDYAERRDAGYVGLLAVPEPDRACPEYPAVGEVSAGRPYRVSLQAAIWNKQVLTDLLVDGESPWEMEHAGSLRSAGLGNPFLCLTRDPVSKRIVDPPLSYVEALFRGRWDRRAVALCRRESIPIDLAVRPVITYHLAWHRAKGLLAKWFPPALTIKSLLARAARRQRSPAFPYHPSSE